MSSSVPACTFLPFCFLCILPPWASPLNTLPTQLPSYPSRVASLLFSARFPSSKGISSSSTDSTRSLYSSQSGKTETVSGEAGPAAVVQPSREEEGPPQDRYRLGTGLHAGNPTSDSSASQLLAFDSPQVRAGEREPHRG